MRQPLVSPFTGHVKHVNLLFYRRIYVSPYTAIRVEVDMLDMVTVIAPVFS